MSQSHSAFSYVIYLLAKRDYSEQELRQKLKLKAYSIEESDEAIARAQSLNYQSDERFCRSFIRYRALQGYGPCRLKQELQQKGVKGWIIEQELAQCELDWFELAEHIFEKKCPTHWDLKAKQKMWRYMISHGFYNDHFSHLLDLDYEQEEEYNDEY